MKPEILLLVPTLPEIEPFLRQQGKGYNPVITGIGPYRCAAATQEVIIQRRPDMMILCGIAGRYPASALAVGDAVLVGSERAADMGSFEGKGFVPKFSERYDCPHIPADAPLPVVASNSVSRSGLASCRSERRTDREYGRGRFFRRLPARANTFLGAPRDLEYGRRAFRPMEYSAGDRRAGPSDRPPAANGGKYVPHRAAFRRHISLRPDGIASGRAAKAAYCAAPSAYQAQTKRIETQ